MRSLLLLLLVALSLSNPVNTDSDACYAWGVKSGPSYDVNAPAKSRCKNTKCEYAGGSMLHNTAPTGWGSYTWCCLYDVTIDNQGVYSSPSCVKAGWQLMDSGACNNICTP